MQLEVIQYRFRGFPHAAHLGRGQGVEEEFADASDVGGGCGADGRKSGLGEMTTARWKQLIDQLIELKVIEKDKAPIANKCFVGTNAK